jgi:UDP-3-O-[3-hydroxymyristoyl] glucosamine N-acyltransferase
MWFGLVGLLLAPAAHAADVDENGCEDAYEVNGACVSITATVDPTATVGATSQVQSGASVGPNTAIGSGVTIGERSSLAGRDDHVSNPVSIGDDVIIARGVTLGFDHVLGAGTILSRSVTSGADLTTGADASVGYASQLGSNVTIGDSAVLGSLVTIGDYAEIGSLAVVSRNVTVASAPNSTEGSEINGIVGPSASIGTSVVIQSGARIRKRTAVLDGATVESAARVGRDATIGADSIIRGAVRAEAIIGTGATVGDGARVRRGAVVCAAASVPNNESVSGFYPPEGCQPATSCKTILDTGLSTGSGTYSIDPDGTGGNAAFDVYCDMDFDGGGWTNVGYNVNVSRTYLTGTWSATSTGNPAEPTDGLERAINPDSLGISYSEMAYYIDDPQWTDASRSYTGWWKGANPASTYQITSNACQLLERTTPSQWNGELVYFAGDGSNDNGCSGGGSVLGGHTCDDGGGGVTTNNVWPTNGSDPLWGYNCISSYSPTGAYKGSAIGNLGEHSYWVR